MLEFVNRYRVYFAVGAAVLFGLLILSSGAHSAAYKKDYSPVMLEKGVMEVRIMASKVGALMYCDMELAKGRYESFVSPYTVDIQLAIIAESKLVGMAKGVVINFAQTVASAAFQNKGYLVYHKSKDNPDLHEPIWKTPSDVGECDTLVKDLSGTDLKAIFSQVREKGAPSL